MKTLYQSLLLSIGVLALAGTALAQVPSTNDTTDTRNNTGMGTGALSSPTNFGFDNTASGFQALFNNTTGNYNTASGVQALFANTGGSYNAASGYQALLSNTTGFGNSASGYQALLNNTTGNSNTASGNEALLQNTTGIANTASGVSALGSNSTGDYNTASGYAALSSNTTGSENTASGVSALAFNTTGVQNTAYGFSALGSNSTGDYNTASGLQALLNNTTGNYNIAEGFQAGYNLTTGSYNIDIGNSGVAGESNLIRIGTKGTHKGAVIAGISTSQITGAAVYVTGSGRLGVLASSERFKTSIAPMGSNTAKLEQLRPVTFHLKTDPRGAVQYGLIAEEVAKVYPELVIRNEKGRIDGVRYDELAPMLLNEMQQQRARTAEKIDAQAAEIRELEHQVAELKDLKRELHAALIRLQAKEGLVAQR